MSFLENLERKREIEAQTLAQQQLDLWNFSDSNYHNKKISKQQLQKISQGLGDENEKQQINDIIKSQQKQEIKDNIQKMISYYNDGQKEEFNQSTAQIIDFKEEIQLVLQNLDQLQENNVGDYTNNIDIYGYERGKCKHCKCKCYVNPNLILHPTQTIFNCANCQCPLNSHQLKREKINFPDDVANLLNSKIIRNQDLNFKNFVMILLIPNQDERQIKLNLIQSVINSGKFQVVNYKLCNSSKAINQLIQRKLLTTKQQSPQIYQNLFTLNEHTLGKTFVDQLLIHKELTDLKQFDDQLVDNQHQEQLQKKLLFSNQIYQKLEKLQTRFKWVYNNHKALILNIQSLSDQDILECQVYINTLKSCFNIFIQSIYLKIQATYLQNNKNFSYNNQIYQKYIIAMKDYFPQSLRILYQSKNQKNGFYDTQIFYPEFFQINQISYLLPAQSKNDQYLDPQESLESSIQLILRKEFQEDDYNYTKQIEQLKDILDYNQYFMINSKVYEQARDVVKIKFEKFLKHGKNLVEYIMADDHLKIVMAAKFGQHSFIDFNQQSSVTYQKIMNPVHLHYIKKEFFSQDFESQRIVVVFRYDKLYFLCITEEIILLINQFAVINSLYFNQAYNNLLQCLYNLISFLSKCFQAYQFLYSNHSSILVAKFNFIVFKQYNCYIFFRFQIHQIYFEFILRCNKQQKLIMFYRQISTNDLFNQLSRPIISRSELVEMFLNIFRINNFDILDRKHIKLNENQAYMIAKSENIKETSLANYLQMMTDGSCEIFLMVKDGAFKEAQMIIGDGLSKKIKENPLMSEDFTVRTNNNLMQLLSKSNQNILGSVNYFNVFSSIQNSILYNQMIKQNLRTEDHKIYQDIFTGDIIHQNNTKQVQENIFAKDKQRTIVGQLQKQLQNSTFNLFAYSTNTQESADLLIKVFFPQDGQLEQIFLIVKPEFLHFTDEIIDSMQQLKFKHMYRQRVDPKTLRQQISDFLSAVTDKQVTNIAAFWQKPFEIISFVKNGARNHLKNLIKEYNVNQIDVFEKEYILIKQDIQRLVVPCLSDDCVELLKIINPNLERVEKSHFSILKKEQQDNILNYIFQVCYGKLLDSTYIHEEIPQISISTSLKCIHLKVKSDQQFYEIRIRSFKDIRMKQDFENIRQELQIQSWYYSYLINKKLKIDGPSSYYFKIYPDTPEQLPLQIFDIQNHMGTIYINQIIDDMNEYYEDQKQIYKVSNNQLANNEHIVPYIWGVKLASFVNEFQQLNDNSIIGYGKILKIENKFRGQYHNDQKLIEIEIKKYQSIKDDIIQYTSQSLNTQNMQSIEDQRQKQVELENQIFDMGHKLQQILSSPVFEFSRNQNNLSQFVFQLKELYPDYINHENLRIQSQQITQTNSNINSEFTFSYIMPALKSKYSLVANILYLIQVELKLFESIKLKYQNKVVLDNLIESMKNGFFSNYKMDDIDEQYMDELVNEQYKKSVRNPKIIDFIKAEIFLICLEQFGRLLNSKQLLKDEYQKLSKQKQNDLNQLKTSNVIENLIGNSSVQNIEKKYDIMLGDIQIKQKIMEKDLKSLFEYLTSLDILYKQQSLKVQNLEIENIQTIPQKRYFKSIIKEYEQQDIEHHQNRFLYAINDENLYSREEVIKDFNTVQVFQNILDDEIQSKWVKQTPIMTQMYQYDTQVDHRPKEIKIIRQISQAQIKYQNAIQKEIDRLNGLKDQQK